MLYVETSVLLEFKLLLIPWVENAEIVCWLITPLTLINPCPSITSIAADEFKVFCNKLLPCPPL